MSARERQRSTKAWIAALVFALAVLVVSLITLLRTPPRAQEAAPISSIESEPEPVDARAPAAKFDRAPIAEAKLAESARTAPPPEPVGPIDGIVLDAATGEAVPECDVHLACGEVGETVHTNAHGAFATVNGLPAGEVEAIVSDLGEEVGRERTMHKLEGTRGWRIRVPIGPTYPFLAMDDVDPQPEHWQARIVATCVPDGRAGVLAIRAGDVKIVAPGGERPDHAAKWLTLRDGNQPWLRYPRAPFKVELGYRGHLELRNDTVHRVGQIPILSVEGIHTPLAMVCERYCVVAGHVGGLTRGASARVMVFPVECVPKVPKLAGVAAWNEAIDDGHGFEIEDVTPGGKMIVVLAPGHHVVMGAFDTDSGSGPPPLFLEPGTRELPVEREQDRSTPDEIEIGVRVLIDEPKKIFGAIGPTSPIQFARHVLEDVGPLAGAFVSLVPDGSEREQDSASLPIGGCNVTMIGLDAPSACDDLISRGPLSRLEIPKRTIRRPPEHVIHVRDAGSGDEVHDAHVVFTPPGTMLAVGVPTEKSWKMGTRSSVTFSVWAHGYQPAFGNTASFAPAGGDRAASFALVPGLGAQLFFRADEARYDNMPHPWTKGMPRCLVGLLSAPPVPGVQVEGSGTHPSSSDENGELRVTASAECELTLNAKGWQLDSVESLDPDANAWIVWLKSTAADAPHSKTQAR